MSIYQPADARRWTKTYRPPVRETVVLWTPNARRTFSFGHEFGRIGYVVGESFEDAYYEMLDYFAEHDGPCDHGGDITDEQRMLAYAGEPGGRTCDCSLSDTGVWVWDAYLWMRELPLVPVDFAYDMEGLTELFVFATIGV